MSDASEPPPVREIPLAQVGVSSLTDRDKAMERRAGCINGSGRSSDR